MKGTSWTRIYARTPKGTSWTRMPTPRKLAEYVLMSMDFAIWRRGSITVISELALCDLPDGSGSGLQWTMSISRKGRRPKAQDVKRALRAFGMVGAEEDNHSPGRARHFWRPVDPDHRVDCQCKDEETTIVEPDGYSWTNPSDESEGCRGCEFESMSGDRCPIHGANRP